jgi:hypothetical protein
VSTIAVSPPNRRARDVHGRIASALAAAIVAAGGLITGGVVAPAHGQVVRGALVDYGTGAPVPGGAVALLDSAGIAVDSTRSTAAGTFSLRAPTAGVYALYFFQPGYASVPSDRIRLTVGDTVEYRFAVPLISGAAIQRMSEVIDVEKRLQSDLTELCGEPPRPTEAGIVVGVVRRRPGGEPLAGAVIRVEAPRRDREEGFHKATVSSANGVYVICNVPAGNATTRTELIGYRADEGPIEVRAGAIAWYDVHLRAR